MSDEKGFYCDATPYDGVIGLGVSLQYAYHAKDLCLWIRLFNLSIHIGYQPSERTDKCV